MANLKQVKRGQTVTEQVDIINENVNNINDELEQFNERGYVTEDKIPVKSVNGKTGDVSLSAKDTGAFPNSSVIEELDINNIKDTGVYIGTYATNPYYLIVIKYNDTNIYQELIGLKLKQYRRFTGTWSEWIKAYSTENPVKAGDIKGIELVDTDKELTLALFEDTTFVKADVKYNPSTKSLYVGDNKFATEEFVLNAVNMIKSTIVSELPEVGVENTIYFVPSNGTDNANAFNEYIYVNDKWEIVGGTSIDLTPFLTKEEAEQTYAKISSLDEKVSKTTTINGKTLYNNITLTAEDVGALSKDTKLSGDVVYRNTNTEIATKLSAGEFIENDLVIAVDDGTYKQGHIYKYNSGALTDITYIITDYVNLDGDQTINGTKNFNGILRYGGVGVATQDDLADKVDKVSRTHNYAGIIYGVDNKGEQAMFNCATTTGGYTIAYRLANGEIRVGEPTEDNHATTKKYVEDNFAGLNKSNTFTEKIYASKGINANNSISLIGYEPSSDVLSIGSFQNETYIQSNTVPKWANLNTGGEPTVVNLATTKDIPDTSNFIPQGGTLTAPLKATGGDSTTAGKIILDQNNKGQITNTGTQTLFGFLDTTSLATGHANYNLNLRGKSSRPTYNGSNMALQSDLGTQATFSLSGTTLTITPK